MHPSFFSGAAASSRTRRAVTAALVSLSGGLLSPAAHSQGAGVVDPLFQPLLQANGPVTAVVRQADGRLPALNSGWTRRKQTGTLFGPAATPTHAGRLLYSFYTPQHPTFSKRL